MNSSKDNYENFRRNDVIALSEVISSMLPPLCFIIWREILRPMPLPVGLVVKKGTKICCASSEDWLAVVADVDAYRVVRGGVGGKGDGCSSCFHGILQYVCHDMGDEALVCVEEKVGNRDIQGDIR